MYGDGALTFVLQLVTNVLKDYKDLRAGARAEFLALKNDLLTLKAFLEDSTQRSLTDELFKAKETEIIELVCDMEDIIESHLAKTAAEKNKKFVKRLFAGFSTDMAQEVKNLRQNRVRPIVDKIDGNFVTTCIGDAQLKKDPSMRQPSVTFIHDQSTGKQFLDTTQDQSIAQPSTSQDQSSKQDNVVDFEEEATIKRYLLDPMDNLDVISITGMAGLGKTTLARKIFQDKDIKFPLRIWIHVSQKFKSRDVFIDILERFTSQSQDTSRLTDDELIRTVRGCLSNEKFLLVMDDVWTVKDWDVIEQILPTNSTKGKVLVTSRLQDVAAQPNVNRETLRLGPLGLEKSLELLKLKVFGNSNASWPDERLENIGKKIANKCGGVPLLIVVIGGILKLQFTDNRAIPGLLEKWSNVLKNVNNFIQKDQNFISDALELSYNTLPKALRVCFLYTGLFPENHEIPASTLTQLWIAEGFIPREEGQSQEENAEKFLEALINKNLLTAAKKNLDQVKTCGVHDMIREFCKVKAEQQNLFRVIKMTNGVIEPPVSEVQDFRRLCLHSDPSRFFIENPKGPLLRSFLCFCNEPFDLDPTHTSTIPRAFNLLRVLNCKSLKFQQFPKVKSLILLKHICLFIDKLKILPPEISQLVNLQTLIVETNSRSIAVKANIWKMIQLRRLKTKAAISISFDEKKWKGKPCENLQTISRLSPDSCREALSQRAPNLKALGIKGKLDNLFDKFSIGEFSHLEKLKLVNDLVGESASDNPLRSLPQTGHFPGNIKRLTLSRTYLDWGNHMPILARINTLKVLKLKDNAFTGVFWETNEENCFRDLQFLLIENSKLTSWKASTTYFQSLTWLVLKKCKQLENIPETLAKNLQKLEIESVKKSAAESARKIELIKKEAEESQQNIWGGFKLTVGPECDL